MFSEQVLELRQELGLTQLALGRLIGVTGQAIANYEQGIRDPSKMIAFKLALRAPNEELRSIFMALTGLTEDDRDLLNERRKRTVDIHTPDDPQALALEAQRILKRLLKHEMAALVEKLKGGDTNDSQV